ncbi:MAG: hypothetical protein M0R80_25400 [Proteobacteria bacterium]|nr:hypothetical protein [Pseudomonadota bacterium]
MAKLASPSEAQRESALVALQDKPAALVVPEIVRLLLVDTSSEVHAACLDLLERFGAAIDLKATRADDWFDRIGDQVEGFKAISDLMGARVLAYAMILGLQIRSLSRDPHVPANTTVEFESGDGEPQALVLGEFRLRVIQALLKRRHEPPIVELPLADDDAVSIIGPTALLVAPLFELKLETLVASPETPQRLIVGFVSSVGMSYLEWPAFEALIRQLVAGDLHDVQGEPFQLDLTAVETARRASDRGDHAAVVRVLENWPGLLAALQRTPVVRRLTAQQLLLIGEGLLLLGGAFEVQGRRVWSEELYRLGLQLVREENPSAELFLRLGVLLMSAERYGEAIGLLRRAQALGIGDERVLPPLGRALLRRGRKVSAALILQKASDAGFDAPGLAEDLAEVRRAIEATPAGWLLTLS